VASQIFKRVLLLIPSIFGVVTLAFFLIHFTPGDPVDMMLGEQASSANKEALRERLGLNLPLGQQYLQFLKNAASGDLGTTLRGQEPVARKLRANAGATLELSAVAFGLASIAGVILGVLAAVFHDQFFDRFVLALSSLGVSMPVFWVAPLLIYIFAIQLRWFPVSERQGWNSIVLPAVTLAIGLTSYLARMTRASMLEIIKGDFIRTARAKGLAEWRIYFKHALKNAMLPVVTVLGLQLGSLLTGAVVTETIFDWPGIGSLFYNSINNRDYPMVQGCVIFMALIYLVINLLTDLSYQILDPRVRK
jgi:ABC-type dipeptide/oligopeptide/nickel transport system permease component